MPEISPSTRLISQLGSPSMQLEDAKSATALEHRSKATCFDIIVMLVSLLVYALCSFNDSVVSYLKIPTMSKIVGLYAVKL